ncbi:MAG: nuclear transport factor 2 family protein [Nevskia sp.]|nr:nuclear transport factor 2 family protein [Nevskia sp.]
MDVSELERRLGVLEDVEAIRALKARYLASADAKDPAGMRACFVDGPARIDFGPVGTFDRADPLVEVFRQVGCHDYMVEMHHGVNPQIEITGADTAKGHWSLHYQLINTRDKTLTQLGAYYDDEYRRTAKGWKIAATKCVTTSLLVLTLAEDAIKAMVIGRMPAAAEAAQQKAS